MVSVAAVLSATAVIATVPAVMVLIAEGSQQLFRWPTNRLTYRSTAEALEHEKFLYLAHTGIGRGDDRRMILAERIETSSRRKAPRGSPATKTGDRATAERPTEPAQKEKQEK
ncbi:DUF4231 domain-containing protein [Nocardia paucivorans]|uniref:DUF4231 domain-containing protein n=1 Tax=Nocardia paucivorans TaxID=114259 RepID=UPI00030FA51B|nr:DUF4231 domain-containing protein [Nocardia paucivorans]